MRWIWVRHGETDGNRQRQYVGHSDVPLNEQGRAQAKELAELLAKLSDPPVALYTSDLRRCVQTAEPLAKMWKQPAIAVPALRELSFGDWELLTYEQIMEADRERASKWYDDPFACSPPNGESLRQLGQRVDAWLRSIQAARGNAPGTTVFVTHGGVIRWFQAAWLDNDPGRYWQAEGLKNGEALLAEWKGQRWIRQSL